MKLGILFGSFSIGSRPLSFKSEPASESFFSSPRGATGSEISFAMLSKELVKLGHEVSMFTIYTDNQQPEYFEGAKLYNYIDRHTVIDETFDAVISINEPDAFRGVCEKPLRICHEFLNDFTFCQPNFDDYVDLWLSPCQMHCEHLKWQLPKPEKVSVLPLGCSPEIYTDSRVPGRVVWTSSNDRGLHWILNNWPVIKAKVPNANLRIFYHFNDSLNSIEHNQGGCHPAVIELAQRSRYIKYAIEKLKDLGVEHVGSVSREQMAHELSEASVFAFSCDTVSFTEGFSVSTLEACASHTVPIITNADCLGGVYRSSGATIIEAPIRDHLDEFTEAVIKGLTDKQFADETIAKCREFAAQHTWEICAKKMENIINENKKRPAIKNLDIVKLNVGSGPNVFTNGWINYDREDVSGYINFINSMKEDNVNSRWHLERMPPSQLELVASLKDGLINFKVHDLRNGFPHADNSVDLIYMGQVIEHINQVHEAPRLMKEFIRILKPGGILRMATPDLELLIRAYLEGTLDQFADEQPDFYKDADNGSKLAYIMYGATGAGCTWDRYDGHMFLYTETSMRKLLENAGFKDVVFYREAGKSKSSIMAKEVKDYGISHSFVVEAIK